MSATILFVITCLFFSASHQSPAISPVGKVLLECDYLQATDADRGPCHKRALEVARDILDKDRTGKIGSISLEPTIFGQSNATMKEGNIFFDFVAWDMKGYDISKFLINSASVDCASNKVTLVLRAPKVNIDSMYRMTGQLLLIQLRGEGEAHVILDNIKEKLTYGLEKNSVNGKTVISIASPDTTYTMDGWKTEFTNLEVPDPILEEAFYHFIDNNYNLVLPQVAELINGVLAKEMGSYINELYKIFPAELLC